MLRALALAGVLALASCTGGGSTAGGVPVNPATVRLPVAVPQVADALAGAAACRVSADGLIWYTVPAGTFAPLRIVYTDCPGGRLGVVPAIVPAWARAPQSTQTVFAALSLTGSPGDGPQAPLAAIATQAGVPVTWLLDAPWTDADAAFYDTRHSRNGDAVEVAPPLAAAAAARWPWYRPVVAVLGAGHERDVAAARAAGMRAFWGITWNSAGIDFTFDRGAPWGAYCADPASYKRPAADGSCALLSVEWTARDLAAAYFSGFEDAYSTDPDDLRIRAALQPAAATAYVRALVDAYAAAGTGAPILLDAQQEATEEARADALDAPILAALYGEARATGMRAVTLADAVALLAPAAAGPRAVAMPFLPQSGSYGPATIDAHSAHVGLTFAAGQTQPDRVFAYDAMGASRFDVPVPQLAAGRQPQLLDVAAAGGVLHLHFRAPVATAYGVAIWADPDAMQWTSPNVVAAGHAGAVIFVDLPAGDSTVDVGCGRCSSTTFPYAT